MKVCLLFPEGHSAAAAPTPDCVGILTRDLELDALHDAMAAGDKYLKDTVSPMLTRSLNDLQTIKYRQRILADCLQWPDVVRRTYAIAVDVAEGERHIWGWTSLRSSPEQTLGRARELLHLFIPLLRELHAVATGPGAQFRSEGFTHLWSMLAKELGEEFLSEAESHLERLGFAQGVTFTAGLGVGNRGTSYVLREPPPLRGWWERLEHLPERLFDERPASPVYEVSERDEAGAQALGELRSRGIARAATALGQSTGHVLQFFTLLRSELAFYIGAMNLHERLAKLAVPVCFPEPLDETQNVFAGAQLFDVALALKIGAKVVPNDFPADGKSLVIITGANRGGKTTLLRAVGQSQLLMQSGLFVPAVALRASVCRGLFTHFKREEDPTMRSGKLDEELRRMSGIVDRIRPRSLLLSNESFGSTNEREGSEIARQIFRALRDAGIRVFAVTHLFDLADGYRRAGVADVLFLRAERLANGGRTFRVGPGDPLPTSFGEDLYRRIFERAEGVQPPAPAPVVAAGAGGGSREA